ncbi:MAG: hypothetical protein C0180_03490 [Aciduliprofundum sp.]|nr:MAG: hypothetical protein C0180_03490 [Aciduliprofundum sp.]
MSDIFVRAFTDNKNDFKENEEETHNHNIRLIIDTETTIDQYQNLTFGSCLIQTQISSGLKEEWYIFYGNITENEIQIIKDYGKEHNIKVLPVRKFVESVFFPYAYKMRAEVIGFNLPFDLSRLAIDYGITRNKEDAFSLKISNDKRNPSIRIQSIDQKEIVYRIYNTVKKKEG